MKIKKCRICNNKELVQIGSIGNIAISNFTKTPQKGNGYPLELIYCNNCALLQLAHNTPRKLLFKNYWYKSHINPVIIKDLKEIARKCKGVHIDIAANDGTLLKYSKAKIKIAVDPSNIKPDGFKWIQDYWENVTAKKADTITAIACLYALPNPNKFMRNITKHLKPNGVFIAQLMTLQPFIKNNDVGNICHEHLMYFSYKSLVWLYEQNGLEIYKVEKNKINGGSYRIFARHYQKGSISFKEKTYGVKELKEFFERIEINRRKMLVFLKTLLKTHNVVGFGASTKMGTIVQYYKTGPKVIVDVDPTKLGKFTVDGAVIVDKIPKGTEYLWVFPYGFIDYFKKKEKNYEGMWVTTIPSFKII
ncbi:MAG: methyltransferase domain-containing protein [Candidatus Daviesbacteria bacterium]|nr:methyltransferase domain-containing protein [Candidatus Daviesbacteria bacterium]